MCGFQCQEWIFLCYTVLYGMLLGWLNFFFLILIDFLCMVVLVVKNSPAYAGDSRDVGSILGSGRSLGVGGGNPLQYSCLENSTHREAWLATVHGDAKSWTQLSNWACTHLKSTKKVNSAITCYMLLKISLLWKMTQHKRQSLWEKWVLHWKSLALTHTKKEI